MDCIKRLASQMKRALDSANKKNDNGKEVLIMPQKKDISKVDGIHDVFRTVLKWISLEQLSEMYQKISQFRACCDGEIDERKYPIFKIDLRKMPDCTEGMKITVIRERTNQKYKGPGDDLLVYDKVTVPLAAVAPPRNFKLRKIHLPCKIRTELMEFLQISKQLFVGANFNFHWTKMKDKTAKEELDTLLEVFDSCSTLVIYWANSSLTHEFFAKESVLFCKSIKLEGPQYEGSTTFDQNSLFYWLHTTPTKEGADGKRQRDPKGKRQINFDFFGLAYTNSLSQRIKTKFLQDETPHKFVIRIKNCSWKETFHLENQRTGEVLYTVKNSYYKDVIRCDSGEVGRVTYKNEKINKEPIPQIFYNFIN